MEFKKKKMASNPRPYAMLVFRDPSDHEFVKAIARRENTSLSEVLRVFFYRGLEEYRKEKNI